MSEELTMTAWAHSRTHTLVTPDVSPSSAVMQLGLSDPRPGLQLGTAQTSPGMTQVCAASQPPKEERMG